MKQDEKTGRFVRSINLWDGTIWDDGYINSRGRFIVYRPDYPRAYAEGYALRAHVVWWLEYGEVHLKGTNLHHVDGDRLNDKIFNLELKKHGEHTRHHCVKEGVKFVCVICEKVFTVPAWRVRQRKKEGFKIQFCSQKCCHKREYTDSYRQAISVGSKLAYASGRRQ